MIVAKTAELPTCPECLSDSWTPLGKRGRYMRLACDRCGEVFNVEAADVPVALRLATD